MRLSRRATLAWGLGLLHAMACHGAWADAQRGIHVAPKIPRGAILSSHGDGLESVGTTVEGMNPGYHFMAVSRGYFRWAEQPNQGSSGDYMAGDGTTGNSDTAQSIYDRVPYLINTQPQVVIPSMGHNDRAMGTNLAAGKVIFDAIYRRIRKALGPTAWIFLCTTPSATTPAEPNKDAWWSFQMSYNGRDNGLTWVIPQHLGYDPSTMAFDGIHHNDLGGEYVARIRWNYIRQFCEATPADWALDDTAANAQHGANLDSAYALTGNTGTKAGKIVISVLPTAGDTTTINGATITWGTTVAIGGTTSATATSLNTHLSSNLATYGLTSVSVSGSTVTMNVTTAGSSFSTSSSGSTPPTVNPIPTGSVAAGKRVTNNTTASVACSVSGGVQTIDVTGVVSSANTVVFNDSGNLTGSAIVSNPGAFYETLLGVVVSGTASAAPTGVRNFGTTLSNGTYGNHMGANTSGTYSANGMSRAFDYVFRTTPKPTTTVNPNMISEFSIRFLASTVETPTDARFQLRKPIFRACYQDVRGAPIYLGDDTEVANSAYQHAIVGTVANGTTFTAKSGGWSGGRVTFSHSWVKNGSTQVSTSAQYTASGFSATDTLTLTTTASNAAGSATKSSTVTF